MTPKRRTCPSRTYGYRRLHMPTRVRAGAAQPHRGHVMLPARPPEPAVKASECHPPAGLGLPAKPSCCTERARLREEALWQGNGRWQFQAAPQPCHLPAVCPQTTDLTSLGSSVPTYQMGMKTGITLLE